MGHLVSNKSRFNANEPWGMLSAFSPPIHPALLRYPFSDVIKAHIDPLLAVRISEYLRTVESEIKPGQSMTELQETLLHLLHLRRRSLIDENQFRYALSSMIDSESMDGFFEHPELGQETWDRLLSRAMLDCAPFFRLHDRLHMRQQNGKTGRFGLMSIWKTWLLVLQTYLHSFSIKLMRFKIWYLEFRLQIFDQMTVNIV